MSAIPPASVAAEAAEKSATAFEDARVAHGRGVSAKGPGVAESFFQEEERLREIGRRWDERARTLALVSIAASLETIAAEAVRP